MALVVNAAAVSVSRNQSWAKTYCSDEDTTMLMRRDNGLNLSGIESHVLRPITTAFILPLCQSATKQHISSYSTFDNSQLYIKLQLFKIYYAINLFTKFNNK